mgnify:CR=1 FL=1
MKQVILDGTGLTTSAQVHELLARELDFPIWYGANLDALYDRLTDVTQDCWIVLTHAAAMEAHLGNWAGALRQVLRDACACNDNLTMEERDGGDEADAARPEGF